MSDDINDSGTSSNIPDGVKFETVGTEHKILIETVQKVPVREFIKGKPGDQLYFQNNKLTKQSDLVLQLPFEAVPAWLVVGKLKDGTPVSLRLEKDRLKATKAAIREGGKLLPGGVIAIKFTDEEDTGSPYPKKLYEVRLQAPKTSE